ncbi:MAG: hypothetical protein EAX96_20265 [Candidatus Lokiarchaeota archaeon]|nr:hypothetical protein [Candidatus Lokiarchaeota archaeon]
MITIFFVLIPGIILGVAFLAIDYISEIKPIQKLEEKYKDIYISLIGGISISFIFLDVIPGLNRDFPDPILEFFLYFFIFLGFVFIHLTEKVIMQRVENKSQKKIRELDFIEDALQKQEKSLEQFIDDLVEKEDLDEESLKLLVKSDNQLHKKELEVETEENKLKLKIFDHVYKNLSTLHAGTDYVTHVLAGILIINFLTIHYFNAFLFFIFAVLKSIISNPLNRHIKITLGKEEFNIHIFRGKQKWKKILFTSSVPTGIFIGFFLETFVPINQFVYDSFFAFIVGIFFYVTIREVLPERERGKPEFFLLGAVFFSLIIILLNYLESFFLI